MVLELEIGEVQALKLLISGKREEEDDAIFAETEILFPSMGRGLTKENTVSG